MRTVNKTALVTGVNSGIGLALVKKLLREDYRVIGTTRSGTFDGFQDGNFQVLPLELTSLASVNQVAEKLSQGLLIDLLVNNAGIAPDVFENIPNPDSFTKTIETNLNWNCVFYRVDFE